MKEPEASQLVEFHKNEWNKQCVEFLNTYLKSKGWNHINDDMWIHFSTNLEWPDDYMFPIHRESAIAIQRIRDEFNCMSWFKRLFFRI